MILIDADATPNIQAMVSCAAKYHHPVTIVSNHHHEHHYEGVLVVKADDSHDAVDYKITALTTAQDCVVTQDYGLAALVLAKGATVIHPRGFFYTDDNMDALLAQRQLSLMARQATKRYPKHKKRTSKDAQELLKCLEIYLKKVSP